MAIQSRNPEFEGKIVRVLALASQKGGSGKTTLSGHLAVQAQYAGAGPVVLIDIDPQGSLADWRSEEHTSELQSLMRHSDAVVCLKQKKYNTVSNTTTKATNIRRQPIT